MEQGASWEADSFSATQEIVHIYGTQRFSTTFTTAPCPCTEPDQWTLPLPPPAHFLKNLMSLFHLLGCTITSVQGQANWMFCKMTISYGKNLLASCPTPKLEDHTSMAVCDGLFNIFAATLHIGGGSIHNQRMRHAMVTGSYLSHRNNVSCKLNGWHFSIWSRVKFWSTMLPPLSQYSYINFLQNLIYSLMLFLKHGWMTILVTKIWSLCGW
jgi:hypothetical protein